MLKNPWFRALLPAVLFTAINATMAHAQAPRVPLPDTIVLLVAGAAGLAAGGWWTRRK